MARKHTAMAPYRNIIVWGIFFLISTTFFVSLFFRVGDIGISYDWSVPLSADTFIKSPLTSFWNNGVATPPGNFYYVQLFYWLLLNFHVDSGVITKIFLILTFSFSAFSIYLLFKKINLPSWIAVMGGLLYISSAQLLLITHHGYTSYLFSIGFTPLLVYLNLSYLEKEKFSVALAGAVVFNISASQIQFFVINFILLFVLSCFYYRRWKSVIKLFVIFLIVNFLLSASWLLVYLSNPQGITTFNQGLLQHSFQGFQKNVIMDLLYLPFVSWSVKEYLQSLHIRWLYDIWAISQIAVFGLPFVIYGIFRKTISPIINRLFRIGFVTLLIGMVLTKGRAEPFSWLGDWFYRLPLSGMFRDLNHFYYLITFSVVWLFALGIFVLHSNLVKEKKYRRIFFVIVTAFVLLYVSPYLLNVYRSKLHQYQLSDSYYSLIQSYNNDKDDYRVLWLPIGFYVKYNDNQPYYSGINPLINLVAKEDLGSAANKSSLLTEVLQFGYCERVKNCSERFLGLFNVRDVINLKRDFSSIAASVDDRSAFRNERYWTQEYYASWTKKLNDVVKKETNDYFDVYQLSAGQYLPHIYVPEALTWVAGNERNILDGVILNPNNRSGYLTNKDFRDNAKQLIIPLEFTEDSLLDVTHNSYQIITKMNIPEDGPYQIVYYQKRRDTTSPGVIFTITNVDLDNKTVLLEKKDGSERQLQKNNPFYSGKVFLRQGEYKLSFSNTVNNQNLVVNPSFDIGGWPEPTYDCTSEESDYEVKQSPEREHYLQFRNKQRRVCQTRVIGNLQPRRKYLFSYDVQHIAGEQPVICLKLNEEDYCHGINTMTDTADWQHREFIYEQGESDRALIYFSVPGSNRESINNFDNFELRQVDLPETISFVNERDPTAYQVSQIEYRKISNTKYRVILKSASGNVPLIFTENYDVNWQAYVKSESDSQTDTIKKSSGETIQNDNLPTGDLWETSGLKSINDHHKINGYSNVWYYQAGPKPKDIEIIMEYKPQKLFMIGQFISVITLGFIILFFIIRNFLNVSFIRKNRTELP